ncbi:MAG: chemotaxis protein CheW [Myxococcota bacterium]
MSDAGDRLLSFEIHDALFALPIAGVLEVADAGRCACVPTLSPELAWVCNYRGEALPVLSRERLLELGEATTHGAEHVLVVAHPRSGEACFGLEVDRVLGFIAGPPVVERGSNLVIERRSVEGRMATVLDPGLLVERARQIIESAPVASGVGGEG